MKTPLETSNFDTLSAIVFYNNSFSPPKLNVWICEDVDTRKQKIEELEKMSHIEIVEDVTNSVVKRNKLVLQRNNA